MSPKYGKNDGISKSELASDTIYLSLPAAGTYQPRSIPAGPNPCILLRDNMVKGYMSVKHLLDTYIPGAASPAQINRDCRLMPSI